MVSKQHPTKVCLLSCNCPLHVGFGDEDMEKPRFGHVMPQIPKRPHLLSPEGEQPVIQVGPPSLTKAFHFVRYITDGFIMFIVVEVGRNRVRRHRIDTSQVHNLIMHLFPYMF